ncbi:MAG: TolC family protein [Victivallaceae bacterium]|nr:TolC family protein [Victivallaceae bacterium]
MNSRQGLLACLMATAVLGGCYSYEKPPVATMGTTYTERQHDDADNMFDGITNLTLEQAQEIALKNNTTYIIAHHNVAAAHMRFLQSLSGYLPKVTASASLSRGHSWPGTDKNSPPLSGNAAHPRVTTNNFDVGVQATMLFFDGLQREFGVMAANHDEKYYKNLDDDARRNVLQAVATAYNAVLLSREGQRIAEEDRQFQLSSLKEARYKFEAGAVPLSDVLNFEILANNADVKMIEATADYVTAKCALATLLGYPDGEFPKNVEFTSDYKSEFISLPPVEKFLDAALANRPDLKGYREQLQIAKYNLYSTYGTYSPTVSGFLRFGYGSNSSTNQNYPSSYYDYTHTYTNDTSFSYGLTADWVVFSGFARYNQMRERQAQVAISDYTVTRQWHQVVNDVRLAYTNYNRQIENTKKLLEIRNLSFQQRGLVDEEYRNGNTVLTRLNEAQKDYTNAELNLANGYTGIQNAKAQMKAAVGLDSIDEFLVPQQTDGKPQTAPVAEAAVAQKTELSSESAPATAETTTSATADTAEAAAPVADPVQNAPAQAGESAVPEIPARAR